MLDAIPSEASRIVDRPSVGRMTFTTTTTRQDGRDRTVARVAARLSKTERARLEAAAKRHHLPVSELVRQSINAALDAEDARRPSNGKRARRSTPPAERTGRLKRITR